MRLMSATRTKTYRKQNNRCTYRTAVHTVCKDLITVPPIDSRIAAETRCVPSVTITSGVEMRATQARAVGTKNTHGRRRSRQGSNRIVARASVVVLDEAPVRDAQAARTCNNHSVRTSVLTSRRTTVDSGALQAHSGSLASLFSPGRERIARNNDPRKFLLGPSRPSLALDGKPRDRDEVERDSMPRDPLSHPTQCTQGERINHEGAW